MSDSTPAEQAAPNSLGLDLEALKIKDDPEPTPTVEGSVEDVSQHEDAEDPTQSSPAGGKKEPKDKKKPYVNPDRVKTGGTQRDKLSKEELEERMARMREQNEKIKQRRLDVQADEEEYHKKQEADRLKNVKARKIQEGIDKAREQNARRKMEKTQSREWDSGKPATRDWKSKTAQFDESKEDVEKNTSVGTRGVVRGSSRGGGRGRGRGGQATSPTSQKPSTSQTSAPISEDTTLVVTPTTKKEVATKS